MADPTTSAWMAPWAELGQVAVYFALGLCVLSVFTSILGGQRSDRALVVAGRRAMLAAAGLSTFAMLVLVQAFVRHDFSLKFVWQTSSTTTPTFYLLTGVWGGQSGSLMFWSWLMAVFTAIALLGRWRADAALMPWFTAVSALVTGFFLLLVAVVSSPFERLTVLPLEGNGLNPLLQHPGMAFHPPTLYLGFTGMTVPYAFAMAALLSGRLDAGWIRASRRWMLVAWAFLSIGLALGGRWAYDVLGWGGYWGWDPVENAAFMPWLAATAFLHSVMIQERRGTFKVWNMFLIILTFSLVIVGTFLTRAGLVTSVHAFAQSDIGGYFLVFTAFIVIGSLLLLLYRLPLLKSEERIEHMVSREGAFMVNNLLFMGALFAVFWGTLFPLFSEILTDQRVTVGPPYFNRLVVPIFGLLVLLMGFGPLMGWRRADPRRVWLATRKPLFASLLITAFFWLGGVRQWVAVVGYSTCLFAGFVTIIEILRGVRARMKRGEDPFTALFRLYRRDRRRYGGYLVHMGIVLFGIGVVGSNVYQVELDKTLALGESVELGAYRITNEGIEGSNEPDKETIFANLALEKDGRRIATLQPSKQLFRLRQDQPMTIPAVHSRPLEDVYALLGAYDPATEQATLKLYINPLIGFVWFGMLVLVLGTLIAAWPDDAEARVLDAELRRIMAYGAVSR